MKFEAVFMLLITGAISHSNAASDKQATNSTFPCSAGQLCSKANSQNVKNINDGCNSDSDCDKHPDEIYRCSSNRCTCPYPAAYVYAWEVSDNVCVTPRYYIGDSCQYDAQCFYYNYYWECESGECQNFFWVSWKKWLLAVGCVLAVAAIAGVIGFIVYSCKEKKAREQRARFQASQPEVLIISP